MLLRILDRLEEILIGTLLAASTLLVLWPSFIATAPAFPFLSLLDRIPPFLGAGTEHLLDYMGGEIRRGLWRAHRHPCRRRCAGQCADADLPQALVLFSLFCGAFFTAVVGTMGASFVIGLYPTDQTSPDLEFPSWIVFLCIPLGFYLMCFRFLQVAWAYFWTGELPHHDPGHVEGVDKDAVAKELA